ncbi:2-amino-4-hydroxy-6-hydroxymethyldihydropteridine diphosphokinase [Amphritea balenae]|uniref:2-amino-4-hydroxy-6-hydroxymethyldihydropteridine diphosphokinase n=1 Tax=Amphritea balenae TaxID=452629 RepID=A0A3P1SPH9_9GAMM|nr:2-amino-4-hydroxy-6-hydroxymethyldihydropteridine diphosphokinase [Amphritea balenae]RRC99171.1 2-amino-4-hydroxy-6-hydroxymethyldihydropteridine diphosphokinase [Amphritea balenae]GGK73337.1 2-amino-4-hydroxy-6-hydroxymethyldihydropteridine diphosphokinase [Amphritea balenae]
MARVFVSIGSNTDREVYIGRGLDALQQRFEKLELSPVYESEAVGFSGDNFFNLVAVFETDLEVGELSRTLKKIEDDNGRCRKDPKFSGRTLDIDILTYDALIGEIEGVTLPRGEITENAFVLQPLADLAPKERHPVLAETYQQLWLDFDKDKQQLERIAFEWQERDLSA